MAPWLLAAGCCCLAASWLLPGCCLAVAAAWLLLLLPLLPPVSALCTLTSACSHSCWGLRYFLRKSTSTPSRKVTHNERATVPSVPESGAFNWCCPERLGWWCPSRWSWRCSRGVSWDRGFACCAHGVWTGCSQSVSHILNPSDCTSLGGRGLLVS